MSDDTLVADLFPDVPRPPRRWRVTVTVGRDMSADGPLVPAGDQAMLELAAAMLSAEGLITAWTAQRSVMAMELEALCEGDALAAGCDVVRALGCGRGASVEVEPAGAPS